MGALVSLVSIVTELILKVVETIIIFMKWFYLTLLPFIIQYIGLPLFLLGVIMAIAFAGGTLLFTILFCVFMYFFIKGTIFDSSPF